MARKTLHFPQPNGTTIVLNVVWRGPKPDEDYYYIPRQGRLGHDQDFCLRTRADGWPDTDFANGTRVPAKSAKIRIIRSKAPWPPVEARTGSWSSRNEAAVVHLARRGTMGQLVGFLASIEGDYEGQALELATMFLDEAELQAFLRRIPKSENAVGELRLFLAQRWGIRWERVVTLDASRVLGKVA